VITGTFGSHLRGNQMDDGPFYVQCLMGNPAHQKAVKALTKLATKCRKWAEQGSVTALPLDVNDCPGCNPDSQYAGQVQAIEALV